MFTPFIPSGNNGSGGTTVVESLTIVPIANSFVAGDIGKPVAIDNATQTLSILDDTSSSVTLLGVLCASTASNATIGTTGDVINIPDSLVASVSGGAPTAGRYYYWDLSAGQYVAAVPGDVLEATEILIWVADNGNGTHKVELLGMRPYDPSVNSTVTTQVDNYTFALTDRGSLVELNAATAKTFTVPPNSSVAFAIGDTITVAQEGVGQLTIAAGAGVTLKSEGTRVKTAAQYAMATLVKVATDTWRLEGNLVA